MKRQKQRTAPKAAATVLWQIKESSSRCGPGSGPLAVTHLVPLESFAAERPERGNYGPCISTCAPGWELTQAVEGPTLQGSGCPGPSFPGGRAGMQACRHVGSAWKEPAPLPCNLFPSKPSFAAAILTRQTKRRQPPFLFSQSHSQHRVFTALPLLTTIPVGDIVVNCNLLSSQPFLGNQQ